MDRTRLERFVDMFMGFGVGALMAAILTVAAVRCMDGGLAGTDPAPGTTALVRGAR